MTDNTSRETRVLDAVVSLVDSLLDDFDVVELLTDLTERCTTLLDVEAAGLLLADPRRHLHLMAATSEQSRELELLQLQADEGPCLDCYATGHPVTVADLSTEEGRWPRFVPAAADAGYVSVHAVPMRAAGTVLGAMGLFGSQTGDLDDADLLVAQTLAHVACVAILQDHAPTRPRSCRNCVPHWPVGSWSSRPRATCVSTSTSPSETPSPCCVDTHVLTVRT